MRQYAMEIYQQSYLVGVTVHYVPINQLAMHSIVTFTLENIFKSDRKMITPKTLLCISPPPLSIPFSYIFSRRHRPFLGYIERVSDM